MSRHRKSRGIHKEIESNRENDRIEGEEEGPSTSSTTATSLTTRRRENLEENEENNHASNSNNATESLEEFCRNYKFDSVQNIKMNNESELILD